MVVLRLLRLLRLLTVIQGVEDLRVITAGLIGGIKSVTYIMILLLLVIYLFAILGVMMFGANDPVNFGSVATACLRLFQIATLSNWVEIAQRQIFSCEKWCVCSSLPLYTLPPAYLHISFQHFHPLTLSLYPSPGLCQDRGRRGSGDKGG